MPERQRERERNKVNIVSCIINSSLGPAGCGKTQGKWRGKREDCLLSNKFRS